MSDAVSDPVAADPEFDPIENAVRWREVWWRQTDNPLFIWEALSICLHADPVKNIPSWCISYMAEAAENLTQLSWGRDWRPGKPKPTPNEAARLVSAALGLVRQGQKSAFIKMEETTMMHRMARNAAPDPLVYDDQAMARAAASLAQKQNIQPEHAVRKLRKAIKLLSQV